MSEALETGRLYPVADIVAEEEHAGARGRHTAHEAGGAEAPWLFGFLDRVFFAALGAVQGAATGWANPGGGRASASRELTTAVEAVMSRTIDVIGPDATLDEAASRMRERDCGALPVVDARFGRRVIGMVTDRDVGMAAGLRGVARGELRVDEIMTRDVVACRGEETVSDAHRLMREHRIRRLPVVDREGGLVGVIALADLVHHALRAPAEDQPAEASAVLETLGAICRPDPPA